MIILFFILIDSHTPHSMREWNKMMHLVLAREEEGDCLQELFKRIRVRRSKNSNISMTNQFYLTNYKHPTQNYVKEKMVT